MWLAARALLQLQYKFTAYHFNLDIENEGVKSFQVDLHLSPVELNISGALKSGLGIGYIYSNKIN